jgi:hypothetical protein
MRPIYVVIPGPVLTGRLVQELLSNGLTEQDIRQVSLEQEIKGRHPEVRVMGTDPAGSPPFS